MGQYESYLKQFDEEYEAAKAAGYVELPDGKHQARIERAAIEPNKTTGELMLIWEFEIATGEYEGEKVRKLSTIKPDYFPYIKADFLRLNVQVEKFSKLESYLPEVLDLIVNIELKHGKPNAEGKSYQNIYINKLVGKAGSAETANKESVKPAAKTSKGKNKEPVSSPEYNTSDDFSDLPF